MSKLKTSATQQYTKGPWKVFYASNGSMLGVGVYRPSDADHGSGVTDAYGGFWGSGAEKRANAQLVAAAPELLEALQAIVARCVGDIALMSADEQAEILAAQAAIGKAISGENG